MSDARALKLEILELQAENAGLRIDNAILQAQVGILEWLAWRNPSAALLACVLVSLLRR